MSQLIEFRLFSGTLLVAHTNYVPHLTYLFVMLALVVGFALLSQLLPPPKATKPNHSTTTKPNQL